MPEEELILIRKFKLWMRFPCHPDALSNLMDAMVILELKSRVNLLLRKQ